MSIATNRKICLVIGHPISHSLSPKMHNAGYRSLGIDHQFVYIAEDVEVENIPSFLDHVRRDGICGVSCTIPHKLEVIPFLDEIDPIAKTIGAVNTVVNNSGSLKGYNTDWLGTVLPLEGRVGLKDKTVALIGAGGAARGIAYGLVCRGARVSIFNRTFSKAQILARDFDIEAFPLSELSRIKDMEIILNAASVGMGEDKSLIPSKFLHRDHLVFDAVYKPRETFLLRQAKAKGARVIDGTEMLLYQGAEQFRLYTGYEPPIAAMCQALQ